MYNLFILNESLTNGYKTEILDLISILTILSSVYVIISKNPVISILFLIGLFAGIASYLILIGLNFIGLSYLIIYIGAVSILFLFILMLINIRVSELQSNNKNSVPLGIFITILFNYYIFQVLPYDVAVLNNSMKYINEFLYNVSINKFNKNIIYSNSKSEIYNDSVIFANSNNWDNNLIETNDISNIGSIIYTSYNIWLLITSFILILAMTGAIVITIKQK